ncbi:hypothetical protein AB0G04_11535 [Actinoplanes sp. NPDC023801]|uniref:hypothetical protein n=1 Tax=Actinoplanes sp. NPDC023801 TaxID=3154595 RepID=UPI0033D2E563
MSRTTPPRPFDVAAVFPELREHAATVTRLHPRPGDPTAADSSVGGPLLWPAAEPWPHCSDGEEHHADTLLTPGAIRHKRGNLTAARGRDLTDEERAGIPAWDYSEPERLLRQPVPMVPVLQLHRRDVPGFPGPDDCDLLQVVWCPLDHPEDDFNPRPRVYWRRGADITDRLPAPPEPAVVADRYLPLPCVLHPEQVVEYQDKDLLPEDLAARISDWEEETGADYFFDLALAPGWKVGGFPDWSVSGPQDVRCGECGSAMVLLLSVASGEWAAEGVSWRPVEDPPDAPCDPTEVVVGRASDLHIFRCPVSFGHPVATASQ